MIKRFQDKENDLRVLEDLTKPEIRAIIFESFK